MNSVITVIALELLALAFGVGCFVGLCRQVPKPNFKLITSSVSRRDLLMGMLWLFVFVAPVVDPGYARAVLTHALLLSPLLCSAVVVGYGWCTFVLSKRH